MKHFKQVFFVAIAMAVLTGGAVHAQEKGGLTWYTDVNEVYAVASKNHKPVFAFFTGSDWCGWCKRLQATVFSKPEFQAWAKKNVILLELDFPRNKELPEKLAQQNQGLQQFFQVQGYPTVHIFNMEKDKTDKSKYNIAPMGSLGYPRAESGQEVIAFLETANGILKTKK